MNTPNSTDPGKIVGPEESVDEQATIHSLLQSVIAGLIGVVSIKGNLIAFVTLVNNRRVIRTPIYMYIVIGGLALADILNTAMNAPEEIIHKAEKGDLKTELWCKFFVYLLNSVQYITPFHIVVLAVFRGTLLTARDHHGPTSKIAFLTCIILWFVSLLANIPMINLSKLIKNTCALSFDGAENPGLNLKKPDSVVRTEELYTLLSAAFSYFLPLVLIFVIYLVTGYMSQGYFEDSYSARERRLSKMITYIIYVFALCRLPDEMVTLLLHFQLKNTDLVIAMSKDLNYFQVWLRVKEYLGIVAMLDCALRPVIYATMSQEFGAVYDSIKNCRYCKKEDNDDLDPQPLRRRRQEIKNVQSANHGAREVETPLRQSIEVQDYDAEQDNNIV